VRARPSRLLPGCAPMPGANSASAVEWVLGSNEPAVRFLTRRDVLGEDVEADHEALLAGPKTRALLGVRNRTAASAAIRTRNGPVPIGGSTRSAFSKRRADSPSEAAARLLLGTARSRGVGELYVRLVAPLRTVARVRPASLSEPDRTPILAILATPSKARLLSRPSPERRHSSPSRDAVREITPNLKPGLPPGSGRRRGR
jgi:hypothetical protein